MSMRTHVIGRVETAKGFDRILGDVPYGRSRTLRHVVGGSRGGGFERTPGSGHSMLVGITALELDPDRLITKVTSVYDSRHLTPARKAP